MHKHVTSCIVVLFLLVINGYGHAAWDEAFYNPNPLPGDLLVPMPCDGFMVFREVFVPGEGELSDRTVAVGSRDDKYGHREGRRQVHIAGAFDTAARAGRSFYIGKYEVTGAQYDAIVEKCAPAEDGFPVDKVSWFDAVSFAGKYTEWMVQNHPDAMLSADDVFGFFRLPTEVEWEFATRGGIVQAAEYENKTFEMADGIEEYVWFSDPQHSANEVQEIGTLKPNKLGIHDLLGNVSEYVHDAFQLTMHGRLHGQVGGWTVKGGNVLTAKSDIRSSHRSEILPVQNGAVNAPALTGFRLALVAPVERTHQRIKTLQEAWAQLPGIETPSEAEAVELPGRSADPLEEFELLVEKAPSIEYKERLQLLKGMMLADIQRRNDRRNIAAVSQIRAGAVLAERVRNDYCVWYGFEASVLDFEKQIDMLKSSNSSQTEIDSYAGLLENSQSTAERQFKKTISNLAVYKDAVLELANAYSTAVLRAQSVVAREELKQREWLSILPFVDVVREHAVLLASNGTLEQDTITNELLAIKPEGRSCERPTR